MGVVHVLVPHLGRALRACCAVLLAQFVVIGPSQQDAVPSGGPSEMTLADRCQKLLMCQLQILDVSKRIYSQTKKNKKLPANHKRAALELSFRQNKIALEAEAISKMLKRQGVSVAFSEFFDQIRADAQNIRFRLVRGDVGLSTQAIETDVAEALQEMVRALKVKCH